VRKISEIYEAYLQGDNYSNEELIAMYKHFNDAAWLLSQMGDRFRLAANETHRVASDLFAIARARRINHYL
jgi:hypothetical protein